MALPPTDRVREYRRNVRTLAWVAFVVGIVLLAVSIFVGILAAVVGSLLILLGALRTWTLDITPDEVLASTVKEWDGVVSNWSGQRPGPAPPNPPR